MNRSLAVIAVAGALMPLPAAWAAKVTFDEDKAGGPPKSFEGVVGVWYAGEADGKKGLMVDGTRWREGTPSANLADQAKKLYGDRSTEFVDGVKPFASFPLAIWS